MNPLKDPLTFGFILSLRPCYWRVYSLRLKEHDKVRDKIIAHLPATLLEILDWDFIPPSDKLWLCLNCGIRIGLICPGYNNRTMRVNKIKEYLASDDGFPEELLI